MLNNKGCPKENDVLLAVVVPVYNSEMYLRQCLDSIINQEYSALEIVLVDDGSVDNSGKICDEYAANDSRIKVIHKYNEGACYARKKGVELASAEYVTFVDSDDWIDSDMYSALMPQLLANKADVITSGFIKNEEEEQRYDFVPVGVYTGRSLDVLKENALYDASKDIPGPIIMSVCNKVFRKSYIKEALLNIPKNVNLWEDLLYTYIPILNAETVIITHACYYHYRDNSQSATRRHDARELSKTIYSLQSGLEIYKKYGKLVVQSYLMLCIKIFVMYITKVMENSDKSALKERFSDFHSEGIQSLIDAGIASFPNRQEKKLLTSVVKGKYKKAILIYRINKAKDKIKIFAYQLIKTILGRKGIDFFKQIIG